MATWLLLRALEVLDLLPGHRRTELTEKLRLTATELERWEHISRRMFVPFHAEGIISQFEGYDDLKELDWEDYYARYGDISRLDRILEAENDTPNRYKVSKQADVLMLFYLLSADELAALFAPPRLRLGPAIIPDTIDYYLARTSNGSTLSALVHASVLARAHRERAVELFIDALRSDVADVQGGTTAEGIHLAAMAGTVDVLQRCFAGLEVARRHPLAESVLAQAPRHARVHHPVPRPHDHPEHRGPHRAGQQRPGNRRAGPRRLPGPAARS